MVLSVAIGLVQVLLGMVLKAAKAIKNYGFAYAIGTLSWVVAIVDGKEEFFDPTAALNAVNREDTYTLERYY